MCVCVCVWGGGECGRVVVCMCVCWLCIFLTSLSILPIDCCGQPAFLAWLKVAPTHTHTLLSDLHANCTVKQLVLCHAPSTLQQQPSSLTFMQHKPQTKLSKIQQRARNALLPLIIMCTGYVCLNTEYVYMCTRYVYVTAGYVCENTGYMYAPKWGSLHLNFTQFVEVTKI